ncbi:hypothetical protein AOL_s00043g226 [Orbilia oligospora ATCC 24927]|uniref:Uncharacterized protein n=1 Tax=Arthrobotrys oligospora (strain ATCC 24927 / CBS 115.81 / DSM 1491) TaxID=756982 RepID=G1X3F3_ARTOA|nr:hypothetical protein AOL_s00043g226 [Orbilia oligospora ATCC 24927]EGX52437.1 hypothetical protein AOL_s00043g226 [Orbilia oligospora ATCC 24927]
MSERLVLTPILPNGISLEQFNSVKKVATYLGLDSPDLKYFCGQPLQFAAETGGYLAELLSTATLDRLLALKAVIDAGHVGFPVYQLCILRRRLWLKFSKKAGSGSGSKFGFGSDLNPEIEVESPIEKGQYGLAGWEDNEKWKHTRFDSLAG